MSEDSNQGSESDALGRLGETQFESWCSALRWVANRATEDRRGFDFLVHVPIADFGALSASRTEDVAVRKEHLVAVQVKATRVGRIPRMKLSNLRHLAEHPGPSVVVVFEANSSDLPLSFARAHLVHLDSTWVEESVRRYWELEEGVSANAVEVTVPIGAAALMDPPTASSLRDAIRSLGLSDPDKYSQDKIQARIAAGRPPKPFVLNITTKNDAEMLQEVADWSVGLRSSARIPVERVKHFEERFGLRRLVRSSDSPDVDSVEIEVSDSPGVKYSRPCYLDFLHIKTGRRIDVQGEVYNSHARAPFLPARMERVRIVSPGTEFLLARDSNNDHDFQCNFSLPPDGTPLRNCIPIAQLALFLEGEEAVELRFSAERSGIDLSRPGLKFSANLPEVFTRIAHALIRAQRTALFSGLGDEFPVSMEEIDSQRQTLHLIDGIPLRDQSSGTWMTVSLPLGFIDKEDRPPAVLQPFLVRLGGHRIAVLVAVEGEFDIARTNEEVALSTRRVRTRKVAACRLVSDPKISQEALERAFQSGQESLEAEGYSVARPSAVQVIRGWYSLDGPPSD